MGNFSDAVLNRGRNGEAPYGSVEAAIARNIRDRQHGGRPFFHWWGGNAATTGSAIYRIARPNFLEGGGRHMRASVHVLGTGAAASTTAGVIIDGFTNGYDPDFSTDYPEKVVYLRNQVPDVTTHDVVSGELDEVTIGSDNVHLYAGCVYEDAIPDPDPTETVDPTKFGSTKDIIGTQAGSYGSNTQLVDRFDHVWRNRRPDICWAAPNPSYIEFATSSEDYRYIFDQSVGDGGTAPAADGPAMTLPSYASGIGRSATVRVYVFINAAMSGATDAGSIAVAHRDFDGDMQTFAALENPYTFGGTGYAWYPSLGAFDPATAPYFDMPTNLPYDRICIGARSEGATDKARIKSIECFVFPSLA